jgi:HEAT repeat protein
MKPVTESQFDPIEACKDPTYLTKRTTEAKSFSDLHMEIDDIHFVQALHLKGALGEKVDSALLKKALADDRSKQIEVLFYLSRVGMPELAEEVITLITDELKNSDPDIEILYWSIIALAKTKTPQAKLYLKGLIGVQNQNEILRTNSLLGSALSQVRAFAL